MTKQNFSLTNENSQKPPCIVPRPWPYWSILLQMSPRSSWQNSCFKKF
jgi:hypothetical protein